MKAPGGGRWPWICSAPPARWHGATAWFGEIKSTSCRERVDVIGNKVFIQFVEQLEQDKDRAAQLWRENTARLTGTPWAYKKVMQKPFEKLQPDDFAGLIALEPIIML